MLSKLPLCPGLDALGKCIWDDRICGEERVRLWGQMGRDLFLAACSVQG